MALEGALKRDFYPSERDVPADFGHPKPKEDIKNILDSDSVIRPRKKGALLEVSKPGIPPLELEEPDGE